jgi:LuxR family maltose regulon positive regulatory protein
MMARIWQALGDLSHAQEAISVAEQIAHTRSLRPGSASRVESTRLRLSLSQSNLEALVRWAKEMENHADERGFARSDQISCMLIRIFLAQGEYDKALFSSERYLLKTEAAQQIGLVIELLLLQSMAYQGKHDLAHALAALKQALTLAEPHGFIRVFLDEGAPMARLLRHARSQGFALHYITKLLPGFSITGEAPPDISQPLIEPLSGRELEILRLVADGKSNQQIADAVFITSGTVKKHLNNIFGKLSVQSRTQCVARARELNLL